MKPARLASSFLRPRLRALGLLSLALLFVALAVSRFERAAGAAAAPPDLDTPFASVRRIPLPARDLVYSPRTGKLYASVPSTPLAIRLREPGTFATVDAVNTIGTRGNSITTIDPATLALGDSRFVGSEPDKLELSDDSERLYVNLAGSRSVRWLDLATRALGPQFWLGEYIRSDPNNALNDALHVMDDMRVVAGKRDTLAVTTGEVLLFKDGVRRPATTGNFGNIRLLTPATPTRMYGVGFVGDLVTLEVGDNGVSEIGRVPSSALLKGEVYDMKYDGGLLYTAKGQVVDPSTRTVVGRFPDFRGDDYPTTALVATDATNGLVYYLVIPSPEVDHGVGFGTVTVKVFNKQTYALVGSFDIPNVYGRPKGFTRWGANGLAFCSGNDIYVLRTSLIPSSESITLPPSPPAIPAPPPTVAATTREINLPHNDLVYDRQRDKLYASVPSYAAAHANSIAVIDPKTGAISSSIAVGTDPGRLAISDDGQYLYAGLNGEQAVRRVNLATQTAELKFKIGPVANPTAPFGNFPEPVFAVDIEVPPGKPRWVAVSRMHVNGPFRLWEGVGVYEDGVLRNSSFAAAAAIEYSDSPDTLYGSETSHTTSSHPGSVKITFTPTGATGQLLGIIHPGYTDFDYDQNLIFNPTGMVGDPERIRFVGTNTLPGFSSFPQFPVVAADARAGRAYYVTGLDATNGQGVPWKIHGFDLNTNLLTGTVVVQGVRGLANPLVRWGESGLAFGTTAGQIFIVESALVSPAPTPTPTPTPSPTATPTPTPTPTPFPTMTGGKLAFARFTDGKQYEIYVMNPDGTGQQRLTYNTQGNTDVIAPESDFPAWSPDGGRIAFRVHSTSMTSGIYLINPDGTNQRLLIGVPAGAPSWSPDGSKIAFESNASSIRSVNSDGTGLTNLTAGVPGRIQYSTPTWSADGKKLFYAAVNLDEPNANFDIWEMGADGSNRKRLTTSAQLEVEPALSPDGSKIAFVRRVLGPAGYIVDEIHLMNADGSNPTTLTYRAFGRRPTWSPDGTQIAFTLTYDTATYVVTMNPDGSNRRILSSALNAQQASAILNGSAGGDPGVVTPSAANSDKNPSWQPVRPKSAPVITWNNPAAVAYGTALGAAQLNAASSVAGTFVYTPAAGTVLVPGTHTLTARFVPADPASYAEASASVRLEVLPSDAPLLLTEQGTERAVALDAVTWVRGPFPARSLLGFGADRQTRVMLFAMGAGWPSGENPAGVTAQLEDAAGRTYPLAVEYAGKVPGFDWLTQLNVKLPAEYAGTGDVRVSVSLRGVASNRAIISVTQ